MRINFDFLDLEAFLAVKDTGSFHAASDKLGLSQSSVTRRVQKLEDALGAELFERTTRDVRPTLAGKRLQTRAEAMLAEAQETTRALRDESAAYAFQRAQTVTLATIPTVIGAIVGPALSAIRQAGQPIRVRLLDLSANDVAEAVAQGDADFGICSVPMLEPTTAFTQLFEEPLVLAVPGSHPLSSADEIMWNDLENEDLILPLRGTGNRLLIDEALARSNTPLRWSYEVGRTTTALELVSKGNGVAPVPMLAVRDANSDRVRWKPITNPTVTRPVGMLSRLGQPQSDAAARLQAALVSTAARAARLRPSPLAPRE